MWKLLFGGMLIGLGGCWGGSPEPLKPAQFQSQERPGERSGERVAENAPAAPASGEVAAASPATVPATQSASSGQFMTLGTVVAEANGHPIYADKILTQLEPALSGKARQLDARAFRQFATTLIHDKVLEELNGELEFAAASRSLTEDDKKLAEALTMQWRQKKITEAGGALAVAKDKMKKDGMDFDEALDRQYRLYTILLDQERRIKPRVQVGAADIRRYYETHMDQEFSRPSSIKVRVIKIDWESTTDGKQGAATRIGELLQRALHGEDFGELAGSMNDDKFLKDQKGLIGDHGWTQKGAYGNKEVEKAIWELQKGQITEVPIEYRGAYYIAKVEDRKDGEVTAFESEKTQESIRNVLVASQMSKLRQEELSRLRNSAFMRFDEGMVTPAIEMAMQKYVMWKAGESPTAEISR